MSITYHCILSWDGKDKGSEQFDIPYFDFRPVHGHLVVEDRFKYRSDDEQVSKTSAVFTQILRTGEITFPVPADNTNAVHRLRMSLQAGSNVTVLIGLLQVDQSGATKPLQTGMRLTNAKVLSMQARTENLVNDDRQLFYLTSFKSPPPKPGASRSYTAPA